MCEEKKINLDSILGALKEIDKKVSTIRFPSIFGRPESTFKVRISKGGRITVPKEEIEALKLKEGDILQVTIARIREETQNE